VTIVVHVFIQSNSLHRGLFNRIRSYSPLGYPTVSHQIAFFKFPVCPNPMMSRPADQFRFWQYLMMTVIIQLRNWRT